MDTISVDICTKYFGRREDKAMRRGKSRLGSSCGQQKGKTVFGRVPKDPNRNCLRTSGTYVNGSHPTGNFLFYSLTPENCSDREGIRLSCDQQKILVRDISFTLLRRHWKTNCSYQKSQKSHRNLGRSTPLADGFTQYRHSHSRSQIFPTQKKKIGNHKALSSEPM